jgi:hypothetical protein
MPRLAQILAPALTSKDADDGAQVGPLLHQVADLVGLFIGGGAYDQHAVTRPSPNATLTQQ